MEKSPLVLPRRYRWERVPAIVWLMLLGSVAGALILIGRTIYLFTRAEVVTPDDDLSLTVFLGVLCLFSSTVLGAGVYYLCRPAE
jgi:riboflavin transporter FmnP